MIDKISLPQAQQSAPSPVDVYVGFRVRLRRTLIGMTQEHLGEALGITFQQIQKYERGVNRISASRLFDMSHVLKVPIQYFFDDMPREISEGPLSGPRGRVYGEKGVFYPEADDQLSKQETLELVAAYYRIAEPSVRKRMFELMKSLAPSEDENEFQ